MPSVGIAGYGFMGRFHHAAYRKVAPGAVKAVFDVAPEAFQTNATAGNIGTAEADLTGVGTFTDFEAFLEAVEVVDICVPTAFHRDMAVRALEAGKHVLLEKPMALSLEDCDAILRAASGAKGTFMVAQCIRFWPGYDTLLAAAQDKRWGAVRSCVFTRIGGCAFWSPWFTDERKSGGAVVDLLVHDLDLCRVLGGLPASVEGTGTVNGLGPDSGVNAAVVLLRPRDPYAPSLSVVGGWMPAESYPFAMRYTAQFEQGVLDYASDRPQPLLWYPRKGEPEAPALKPGDGYEAEIAYFLSILGGTPERCPPEESRDAVALALAARRSIQTGKAVAV